MRKQLPIVSELHKNFAYDADNLALLSLTYICKNGFVRKNKGAMDEARKIAFIKRPGIGATGLLVPAPAPVGGSWVDAYSQTNAGTFYVYSNNATTECYFNNVAKASPAGWTAGGTHWLSVLEDGSNNGIYANYKWAITNGASGAVIDNTGALTRITDADYVAAIALGGTSTNFEALDGFLFQGNKNNCRIYQSEQNNPLSWIATDYITASLYPGILHKLVRIREFLVAFKSRSIEFFFNNGNASPGSVLSSKKEYARRYGLSGQERLAECSDGMVWVGTAPGGKPGVFKLSSETFEVKKISNAYIDSLLEFNVKAYTDTTLTVNNVGVLPWNGKELYLIPINIASGSSTATFVYDPEFDQWMLWSSKHTGSELSFPTRCITRANTNSPYQTYVASASMTNMYPLDSTVFRDNSNNFEFTWVSERFDFGSNRRKFLPSLEVIYEMGPHSGNASPTLTMQYDDSDNAQWTAARSRTLSKDALTRAIFQHLGSFRARRFAISMTDNAPLALNAVEVRLTQSATETD